jgi:hypothetical protein
MSDRFSNWLKGICLMPMWTQHLLVLVAVGACVAFIARQAFTALNGRKSRMGGCGACQGCATTPTQIQPQARVQIFPVELLKKKA